MRHKKRAILLLLVVVAVCAGVQCMIFEKIDRYSVLTADKPVVNPLKGWAPWSTEGNGSYPYSMAFVLMKWSEIEPQEGVYEFDKLEEKYCMDELRQQGVRFIIRIVCDYPGNETHMDIPQWLYDKTYGDGQWYDISYGKGYSPNYSNPEFIEAHQKLLEAAGSRYGEDPYVAYIELGSLGHWGEWHVKQDSEIMCFPGQLITDCYVRHYLNHFEASRLLLRRPFNIGLEEHMGLYNDSFGQSESHELWLDWIENGYVSEQSKEKLSGMGDFWKYAPSGGEFSSALDDEYYFSEGFQETMELIARSHTTFLGPHCAGNIDDALLTDNVMKMSSELGYCFQIKEAWIARKLFSRNITVNFILENIGIAPIYENWNLQVRVVDSAMNNVYVECFDIGINTILPGQETITLQLKDVNLKAGEYKILIGLIDPITNEPGIRFANQHEENEFECKIMEFSVK